jgi:hypothetical protein
MILGFDISIPADKLDTFLQFFFRYLEDNGMRFEDKELYADEEIEVVDVFKSMDVKFQRFLHTLEQAQSMDIPEDDCY